MTEEQIERAVERKFDVIDRRLMAGELSQEDYDFCAFAITEWARGQYESRSAE